VNWEIVIPLESPLCVLTQRSYLLVIPLYTIFPKFRASVFIIEWKKNKRSVSIGIEWSCNA